MEIEGSTECKECKGNLGIESGQEFYGNEIAGYHAEVICSHCGETNRVKLSMKFKANGRFDSWK